MTINDLWVERYRPQTLDDLIISDENRSIIEGFGKNIPHLLLTGTPGVGKTSAARIIVKDILKCDYLYINASDENGIDTIREKVIGFSQTKSFDGELKVVILDESDALTKNAQDILRNVMESYASTTRFILTGNYKHKISSAIQSRCQFLDLKPEINGAKRRCVEILKTEGIKVASEQVPLLMGLIKRHFPDLRRCINDLQKYSIDGVLNIPDTRNVNELCQTIYEYVKNKDTFGARKYLIENDDMFGGDYEQLLNDLVNFYYDVNLPDSTKKSAIMTIADFLYKIVFVKDREICSIACLLALEEF